MTSMRDEKRHPWMCSHGYVMIRVDMRGSGDSDGLCYGEYEPQEQDDCIEVIDWIRKQPWSSGNVGMYGKSWGGFNGLQIASRNPEGLKGIISIYSTDDRYDDNSHYKGGCITPAQMLSWSSHMLTFTLSPPDPQFVGVKWKDMWLKRLKQAGEPWVNTWTSHQTRDEFWKHASICEDYSKIKCGVFLIGGWLDGYHNAVFRMAENLTCDWKAMVGPWPHDWPDDCVPGPNIAYLPECLRFWDYHLKGIKNGLDKEPRLRLYLEESK
ncbi:family hydrolase [Paramuricea clavata]|uniref:Family hydrolase n=1 Tax=Paramuricea clavata TaxID=317549 RepID=A0A6S7K5V8_PARCT|nr:family hydrolase [Paramuricea clavata]